MNGNKSRDLDKEIKQLRFIIYLSNNLKSEKQSIVYKYFWIIILFMGPRLFWTSYIKVPTCNLYMS